MQKFLKYKALGPLRASALVVIATCLLGASPTIHAQLSGKGAITGTVADPSGAKVPNATVTVTNTSNGVTFKTTSTSAGDYSAPTLDPGIYTVTVSASGFSALAQQSVHVNALETATVNIALQLGASNETVTVTTTPPSLDTTDAVLGTTMENDVYSALPLAMGAGGQPDQRRATDFAALMPGVQTNVTGNGNLTTSTGLVNGSRGSASAVYIDGMPFTAVSGEGDPRFVWTAISVDSVDQFQVQTAGYSALYEGQGVQNYTIKSGGNQYHGAVYEYFRNTVLDTYGFFGPQNKDPFTGKPSKPTEHQNEYGIYLSGPLLPWWKDKLFAYANYDGYRYSHTQPTYMTFPNAKEQAGDFSDFPLPAALSSIVFDPDTQAACTAAAGGKQCRYAFTGSRLTRIAPLAAKMQSMIPKLTNQNLTSNYLATNPGGLNNWSTTDRIDFVASPRNTLTFIAAIGRQGSSVPVAQSAASGRNVGPIPYNYGQAYAPKTAVGIVENTYTFTPHLINQLKYGFARYNSTTTNPGQDPSYSATTDGISGLPGGQAANAFPITTFSGLNPPTNWGGTNANAAISNSYILLDNIQWLKGGHSITAGVQFGWMQYQNTGAIGGTTPLTLANSPNETAQFQSNGTSLVANSGVAYASFLLGDIDKASFSQNVVAETGARFHTISPYVQDDWKVNSRLSLSLGLRYDFFPTYREANNVGSFFDPNQTNPVTGSAGAIQYTGFGAGTCNCTSSVNNYYKNFAPRIGFAYQSDANTVWRGSYGLMFTHGNGVGGGANSRAGTGTLGFTAAPSFSANSATFQPGFAATGTTTPFPAYAPALGVASGHAYGTGYTTTAGYTGTPSSLGYADPVYGGRAPEYINWTFGFQHQFPLSIVSNINYVGSEGHFLAPDSSGIRGYWSNQLDPKYLALNNCLTAAVNKQSTTTTIAGVPCTTATSGIAVPAWFTPGQALSTALKPFPQYGVSDTWGNTANSIYHSLQLSVTRRGKRLTLMANYTWSRAIDDAGTFRSGYAIPAQYSNSGISWDADRVERTIATTNQPERVVITGVWALPFGEGHLGGGSAWSRAVFGGFKFSGIFQANSGSPLALTASACQTNPSQSTCLPNLNPSFTGSARVHGKWGQGITADNPTAISFIAPSGGTEAAPTGPFINPSLLVTTANFPNGNPYAPSFTFSNAPRTGAYNLYGPGFFNIDISLRRSFALHLTSVSKLNLQADLYNVTNRVVFGPPNVQLGNAAFGTVNSQANDTRKAQLSARIEF